MTKLKLSLVCALLAGIAAPALAADLSYRNAFVQSGAGKDGLHSLSVGAAWPWEWKKDAWGGRFTGATEVYASSWRARNIGGGHQSLVQLGVVPMLRYRFSQGQSPWFVEGGIGISVTDKLYVTPSKTFSTRANFSDNLAVGRNFGDGGRHELSLRLQHISNANLKRPNPGEEFVQLRYARAF